MSSLKNALTLKSKTINFNILAGAIVTICQALGYDIPTETVTAGFTILNVVLRFITKTPLGEK